MRTWQTEFQAYYESMPVTKMEFLPWNRQFVSNYLEHEADLLTLNLFLLLLRHVGKGWGDVFPCVLEVKVSYLIIVQ